MAHRMGYQLMHQETGTAPDVPQYAMVQRAISPYCWPLLSGGFAESEATREPPRKPPKSAQQRCEYRRLILEEGRCPNNKANDY